MASKTGHVGVRMNGSCMCCCWWNAYFSLSPPSLELPAALLVTATEPSVKVHDAAATEEERVVRRRRDCGSRESRRIVLASGGRFDGVEWFFD